MINKLRVMMKLFKHNVKIDHRHNITYIEFRSIDAYGVNCKESFPIASISDVNFYLPYKASDQVAIKIFYHMSQPECYLLKENAKWYSIFNLVRWYNILLVKTYLSQQRINLVYYYKHQDGKTRHGYILKHKERSKYV